MAECIAVATMCHAGGAKAFVSGRGYPKREVIDQFHKRGMVSPLAPETTVRGACIAFLRSPCLSGLCQLVGCVCGRVKHATGAVEAGVDFVIVQASHTCA